MICSLALAKLRTDIRGDLSNNNAVGMAQKLLLFWRKPARRCWWEGIELENVDGIEGKVKIWIRRVWTLEMVRNPPYSLWPRRLVGVKLIRGFDRVLLDCDSQRVPPRGFFCCLFALLFALFTPSRAVLAFPTRLWPMLDHSTAAHLFLQGSFQSIYCVVDDIPVYSLRIFRCRQRGMAYSITGAVESFCL